MLRNSFIQFDSQPGIVLQSNKTIFDRLVICHLVPHRNVSPMKLEDTEIWNGCREMSLGNRPDRTANIVRRYDNFGHRGERGGHPSFCQSTGLYRIWSYYRDSGLKQSSETVAGVDVFAARNGGRRHSC